MKETSLLGHLYPFFRGSQEDVATTSLNYILSSSECINNTFVGIISDTLGIATQAKLRFKCQVVGENSERPDMAGYDSDGNERVLCESKFYAALTANQPNEYIRRLIKNGETGLVFICPEVRLSGLWNEIEKLINSEFFSERISPFCVEVEHTVRVGVTTWKKILNRFSLIASTEAPEMLSDIIQLQGYCNQMDREAFVPFVPEELGADIAIREERPYRLLDELVETIKKDPDREVSLGSLRKTPIWSGYRRFLLLDSYAVTLEYDTVKWKNTMSKITPFWAHIQRIEDGKWVDDDVCEKALLQIDESQKDGAYLALVPKCYVALGAVAEDMKEQLLQYLEVYKRVVESLAVE